MTAGGREFQVAGAAQLKDRLPISVRLNGTSRNGTADDRSDRRQMPVSSSILNVFRSNATYRCIAMFGYNGLFIHSFIVSLFI